MALLKKARAAQYPLVQEYIFNFGDQTVDVNGVTKDFFNYTGTTANPVFELFNLPMGAVVKGGDIIVEVAYVGPTAATLSLGDTGLATRYATTVDLKTLARTALTLPSATTGGLNMLGTLALTVANATAGKIRVRVEYTIENRANEVQPT